MTYHDDGRDFLDVDECAKRMGISINEVMDLVRIRALRAIDYGYGLLFVEPAILSGSRRTTST